MMFDYANLNLNVYSNEVVIDYMVNKSLIKYIYLKNVFVV